jgi:tetratricopeptide (TPR) repeat protein
VAVLGAVAGGAWLADRVGSRGRLALSSAPLLGGLLGLGVAPFLLAVPAFGAAAGLLRFVASLVILGPVGFAAGTVLVRAGGAGLPPFLSGMLLGSLLVGPLAGLLTPPIALLGVPLVGLGASLAAGGGRPAAAGPDAPPATRLAGAVGVFLLGLSLAAWTRFLLLICGSGEDVRATLLAVAVTGLLLGAVGGRLAPAPGRSHTRLAALALTALALWLVAVTASTRSLAVLYLATAGAVRGSPLAGVGILAAIVLLPVAALGSAGVAWLWSGSESPVARARGIVWLVTGIALGLVADAALLPAFGPGRLLLFCAAALPLGLALPVCLGAAGPLAPAWRWAGSGILILAAVGSLLVPPPPLRLLGAGIGWETDRFRFNGRPVLEDRLGRRRVIDSAVTSSGLLVRRQVSGHPVEIAWQGWRLAATDPVDRGCGAVAGLLPALLHRAPRRGLLVGADGSGILSGLGAVPDLAIDAAGRVPGLSRFFQPERRAGKPEVRLPSSAAAWASGRGYDIVLLRPLPPRVSASGLSWSLQALRRGRRALKPNGVLTLSVEPGAFSEAAFRRVLATFLEVFPDASLWFDGRDLILVGSKNPLRLSLPSLERRFRRARPAVRDAGLMRPVDLLARFVMPAGGMAALATGTVPETVLRPALTTDPPPGESPESGGRVGLLARLPVIPEEVLAFFPDLDEAGRESLLPGLRAAASATLHMLRSRGFAETDLPTALEHAQAAHVLRPEDQLVRSRLAELSFRAAGQMAATGDRAAALGWAERAVELGPSVVDHHLALYDLLLRMGRLEAAERRLNDLAARFPESYPVQLLLARRRLEQGDLNAAEVFLRRGADTGYETADLAMGYAQLAFARGQTGRGRGLLARALGLGLDPALVLADMGSRLLESDPGIAAEFLTRARELGHDGPQVTGSLGRIALQDEDYGRAIGLLERAVDDEPHDPRLRLDLGTSLLLAGRSAEALPHLQEAVRLAPGDPLIRLNLAAALTREGLRDEARAQIEQIGDRLVGNPILLRLRQDLGLGEAKEDAAGS